jgi:hypothetical protein
MIPIIYLAGIADILRILRPNAVHRIVALGATCPGEANRS